MKYQVNSTLPALLVACFFSSSSAHAVPVLFERNYTNHAWGYQNKGCFVDEGGYVYTYGEPGKPISLLRKLTLPDLDIAKKELQEAAKGSYSERSGARDAGVRSWVGFHWGKAVLLRKSGDVIGTNSSDRAGLLVEMIEKFCRVIPKR